MRNFSFWSKIFILRFWSSHCLRLQRPCRKLCISDLLKMPRSPICIKVSKSQKQNCWPLCLESNHYGTFFIFDFLFISNLHYMYIHELLTIIRLLVLPSKTTLIYMLKSHRTSKLHKKIKCMYICTSIWRGI